MSELNAGVRRYAYADPSRTLKRRTIFGTVAAGFSALEEIPLPILHAAQHLPITHLAETVAWAVFAVDVVLHAGVKIRRWARYHFVIIRLPPDRQG